MLLPEPAVVQQRALGRLLPPGVEEQAQRPERQLARRMALEPMVCVQFELGEQQMLAAEAAVELEQPVQLVAAKKQELAS